MDWYVLSQLGSRPSLARAASESEALKIAVDHFRRGALIQEIGRFSGKRRKVILSGPDAMARAANLSKR
jgi:hypothetical protein